MDTERHRLLALTCMEALEMIEDATGPAALCRCILVDMTALEAEVRSTAGSPEYANARWRDFLAALAKANGGGI